jgi:hypothetical protein
MSIFEAPMLPSAALRQHYAFAVADRIAKIKASLHDPILDGLGDLALALARQPIHRCSGTQEQFAALMAPRWTHPEATAILEVATRVGIFQPLRNGSLRPHELGHLVWFGARRLANSDAWEGLIDHRLNGLLFDMFAMCPAIVRDRDRAMAMVRDFNDREGPWESLIECGAGLASAAVAWGAHVEDELRYHLLTRAEHWVAPIGLDHNRETGTAILVEEARNGPFRDEVIALAMKRLTEIVEEALGDPDLAAIPAVLSSLDSQLAILVAGFTPNEETMTTLMEQLPPAHAHRVARAIAQISAPGLSRNEAMVKASQMALAAGDPEALGTLSALVEPLAGVIGPMHDLFQAILEHPPGELQVVYQAMSACRAIGHWEACPELTLHLLSRIVVSPADPDLRIAAAEALSRHIDSLGRAHGILLETLGGQLELGDRAQAIASCIAGLHLGSNHLRLGALALAFAADGGPVDLLGRALDAGSRWNPLHLQAFEETLGHYADDATMQGAAMAMLTQIADRLHHEAMLGPFFTLPPHEPIVRLGIARMMLPVVADLSRPDWSAEAAAACGWVLRGDPAFALTCFNLREQATEPRFQALYDLAMGATGIADAKVLDRLSQDCAHGPPELAAAAAVSLRVLLETVSQAAPLDDRLAVIRARVDLEGPQQGPILVLLHQLATMPTGAP